MRGFRDILRTSCKGMMRRGGDSGGIFKGGRREGETQYVLPRPPFFGGLGSLWRHKDPQAPTLNEANNPKKLKRSLSNHKTLYDKKKTLVQQKHLRWGKKVNIYIQILKHHA